MSIRTRRFVHMDTMRGSYVDTPTLRTQPSHTGATERRAQARTTAAAFEGYPHGAPGGILKRTSFDFVFSLRFGFGFVFERRKRGALLAPRGSSGRVVGDGHRRGVWGRHAEADASLPGRLLFQRLSFQICCTLAYLDTL